MNIGTRVENPPEIGIPDEGSANIYYGLIRNGKTYGATADIWELLAQGEVVYATWPIDLSVIDERDNFMNVLLSLIFPWRKLFYRIDRPKNFHFIDAETGNVDGEYAFDPLSRTGYIEYLNKLNHCVLFIDEAWRVIDSYKGVNIGDGARNLILVTGHKYRTVNLITQRPTAIQVTARGNCSRFYKFVKVATWPFPRFVRYEFQVMTGETVDETQEPISTKSYWLDKNIANSYNSHFYGDLKPLHVKHLEAYTLTYRERLKSLFNMFHVKPKQAKLSTGYPQNENLTNPF